MADGIVVAVIGRLWLKNVGRSHPDALRFLTCSSAMVFRESQLSYLSGLADESRVRIHILPVGLGPPSTVAN